MGVGQLINDAIKVEVKELDFKHGIKACEEYATDRSMQKVYTPAKSLYTSEKSIQRRKVYTAAKSLFKKSMPKVYTSAKSLYTPAKSLLLSSLSTLERTTCIVVKNVIDSFKIFQNIKNIKINDCHLVNDLHISVIIATRIIQLINHYGNIKKYVNLYQLLMDPNLGQMSPNLEHH